ncbi:TolB family protein [Arcticibacter tournemirensis]
MRKRSCLILCVLFIIVSCAKKDIKVSSIGLYDISKDDRHIVFSFNGKENKTSIFQIDTNGALLKEIIPASTDSIYYNPRYNSDGSKILFICSSSNANGHSSLYISNSDGSQKKRVLEVEEIITEAIFSDCERKIYYIGSKELGHSSPLGKDQPHLANIYSLNLEDGKVKQETNLDAYSIFRVSEYKCDSLLMYIPYPSTAGMVSVSKKTLQMERVQPANNPRNDSTLYYIPNYSKQFNMLAFTAPYELYIMSMVDKQAKLVTREGSMISEFKFFNTKRRILYTNESQNCFYYVDFGGGNKRTLKLNL